MKSEEIKNAKQKYIHEIIEVERQIRQISHELSDDKRAIINNFQLKLQKDIRICGVIFNNQFVGISVWKKNLCYSWKDTIEIFKDLSILTFQ